MIYNFNVMGDKITLCDKSDGVSGNMNSYVCRFSFDKAWLGLTKFVVFTNGDITLTLMLSGNTCYIPDQMLVSPATICVGVYASSLDGENPVRISTDFSHIVIKEGAYRNGDAPAAPEPELWEQFFEEAAKKAAELVEKNVDVYVDKAKEEIHSEAKAAVSTHLLDIEKTLGDIGEALDNIIKIQNSLIEGVIQ